MSKKEIASYDQRFLESFAGKLILSDPKIAIIELLANAWDAGATEVVIKWPLRDGEKFSIKDNGHGMTKNQFRQRYMKLAYDRTNKQGSYAEIPLSNENKISKRPAFGKNGKGRLSGFAFGEFFQVKTWREGKLFHYKVEKDVTNTLSFQNLSETNLQGHGTEIFVDNALDPNISIENIKSEIGMRFISDPNFEVVLNGDKITFFDIPEENVSEIFLEIPRIGKIKIIVIDIHVTDKSTNLHGVAWHVKKRLVGECTWKGTGNEHLIDGRNKAAKRFVFLVNADCLEDAVLPDWTDFNRKDNTFDKVFSRVQEQIRNHLLDLTKEDREKIYRDIESNTKPLLKNISLVSREKWGKFVTNVQEECPSIKQKDLEKIAKLLATLEQSDSKYSLIAFLSQASVEELDDLTQMLEKWDINFAKLVLDEIEYRMVLLEKLQARVINKNTDEVHELQPLFHRGLWIFGPEYETIQYTSNVGMTRVIQDLYGKDDKGSRNRPDFAILRDSSVGLYSFPKYDKEGAEIGIDRLTIVELKKPGLQLGEDEINQAWKYVKELSNKGYVKPYSKVTCFVLGSEIKPEESEGTTKFGGRVTLLPLDYDTVIKRAESRLLNLFDKVRNSPFLEDTKMKEYLREREQRELSV